MYRYNFASSHKAILPINFNYQQKQSVFSSWQTLSPYSNSNKEAEPVLPTCQIIPFITGRRPIDEIAHPGLGSSDSSSLILQEACRAGNRVYILFQLDGLAPYLNEDAEALGLDVSLAFSGSDGSQPLVPLPGWQRRPVPFQKFVPNKPPTLQSVAPTELSNQRLVIELTPEQDLLPGKGSWTELAELTGCAATDKNEYDPFSFGQLFSQILVVTLRLTYQSEVLVTTQTSLDVCDTRRMGSLYRRIIEQIISVDTRRQAQAKGLAQFDIAYHPWFPVLLIGADKAALYTRALVEDIVYKERHLTDPRWLMRVGLYLEFLTCLGIFEAVKDELGDILTPAERIAYETSPLFTRIRQHLNVAGWRKVWELRQISFPQMGLPNTGPVSILNLFQKKKATLAFLEVHHEDLKQAIEMAGVNRYNSQETWQRVFRDAERAVLRKTPQAFPELRFINKHLQKVILWHHKSQITLPGLKLSFALPADQDGLFAAACNQYRASMNEVAHWAKQRGLMDYTGAECVATSVSLLLAYMEKRQTHFKQLQERDGYANSLNITAKPAKARTSSPEQVAALVAALPLFECLSEVERYQLAVTAREINLGPMERIIIAGRSGTSLFLVASGILEVLTRQPDGTDGRVNLQKPGQLLGEISLLTGRPRSATVRALEGSVVYEIGKHQYEPLLKAHPELVAHLTACMETNLNPNQATVHIL